MSKKSDEELRASVENIELVESLPIGTVKEPKDAVLLVKHLLDKEDIDEIMRLISARDERLKEEAINEFCADLQHKVELSFDIHPRHIIVMPWEDTVRPIVYKRAALKGRKEQ